MKTHSGKFLVIAALCLASSSSLAEPLKCSVEDYRDTYDRDLEEFRQLVTACAGAVVDEQKSESFESSAKPCEPNSNISAARRNVESYRSDIADLNADKRSLDRRLSQFDERYRNSEPSGTDNLIDLLAAGGRGGIGNVGERDQQKRRRAAERQSQYEDERFELQNRISDIKRQLNREIRDTQRYLADAKNRVERLEADACE